MDLEQIEYYQTSLRISRKRGFLEGVLCTLFIIGLILVIHGVVS